MKNVPDSNHHILKNYFEESLKQSMGRRDNFGCPKECFTPLTEMLRAARSKAEESFFGRPDEGFDAERRNLDFGRRREYSLDEYSEHAEYDFEGDRAFTECVRAGNRRDC